MQYHLFSSFFNFLKKQKGCSAHLTATARPHAVRHLGVTGTVLTGSRQGAGVLPPPHVHFWWLKPHQPRTLPGSFGEVFCSSPELAEREDSMSSPPEPPLPAPPSLSAAWLPVPLAGAAGRRTVQEPRGHGGLNGRSVKAGAGGLRSAQDCLKFRRGFSRQLRNPWLVPAPRKPFPKQDSKLPLTISFQSLTLTHSSAPTASSCGSIRTCYALSPCDPLLLQTPRRSCRHLLLQPQLPPHAACPASARPGTLPRDDQSHHHCTAGAVPGEGAVMFSPPPVLKVNQKHVLHMNACALQVLLSQQLVNATGLDCHRRRHRCAHIPPAAPLPLPQITERFNKMHHLAGFTGTCHQRL